VHLDLKPSNLMIFDGGCLKLIDMDGCVRAGTLVSKNDTSISFSPFYCAPEWARFLTQSTDKPLAVTPSLDVWSAAMTICEVVHLEEIMKSNYANLIESSSDEAGLLFMTWLGRASTVPVPRSIEEFDAGLWDMLSRVLVCEGSQRRTLAQSLLAPCIAGESGSRRPSFPMQLHPSKTDGGNKPKDRRGQLQEARMRPSATQGGQADLSFPALNIATTMARSKCSWALKAAKHPVLALERPAQLFRDVVNIMAVPANITIGPPLRNAFEEA